MTYLQQRRTSRFDQIRFDVLACAEKIDWIQGAFSMDDLILD
jgi:Holliday junction resolvase-like predicted endonuclease